MKKRTSKGQTERTYFSEILAVAPAIKITCSYHSDYVSVRKAISISSLTVFKTLVQPINVSEMLMKVLVINSNY